MFTYLEKLQSEAWQSKRNEILKRDKYTCKDCGETDISSIWSVGSKAIVHFEKSTRVYSTIFLDTGQIVETVLERDDILIPILNVHHTKYILNRDPWEYDNSILVTLCSVCHQRRHENEKILLCDENGNVIQELEICNKCNGNGIIAKYKHVKGGLCFKCLGAGINLSLLSK